MLRAQNSNFSSESALKKSISVQKNGMIVLGSWATLNIISGSIGFYNTSGDAKYFHQMNTAWNIVNLGIAGLGYRGANRLDLSMNHNTALMEIHNFERLLLINAGLDLIYIGSGVLLWKQGLKENSVRQTGYGKSLILQGSFLLIFDTTLYLFHRKHTKDLLQITDKLTFTGNGLVLSF
ncbi:MAG: hypothetical protein JXR20_04110 [Balneola sp.]